MTLAHDVAGDGPVVLLIHAGICDRRMWGPQVPALTGAGFRVLRCDLREYGETPPPDGPYSNAGDVLALLDDLGLDRVAVVGASGGGRVALEVAARFPARVTRLALLCTAAPGHEMSPAWQAVDEREEALLAAGDVEGATELMVETFVGPDADSGVRDLVREMQRAIYATQLAVTDPPEPIRHDFDPATITAPTLLVSGAHDLPDFTVIATGLAGRIPDAEHLHLDWAGHLPTMERPAEMNARLLDFLGQA